MLNNRGTSSLETEGRVRVPQANNRSALGDPSIGDRLGVIVDVKPSNDAVTMVSGYELMELVITWRQKTNIFSAFLVSDTPSALTIDAAN